MADNEHDACDSCPYYDEVKCICNSPIDCLNQGVTDESEVTE